MRVNPCALRLSKQGQLGEPQQPQACCIGKMKHFLPNYFKTLGEGPVERKRSTGPRSADLPALSLSSECFFITYCFIHQPPLQFVTMSTTSTSSRKRRREVYWDEIIPSLDLKQFQGEAEKKKLIEELTQVCSTATYYSTLPPPIQKVICTSCGIEGWDEKILEKMEVRGYSYLWHATLYVVQQCTYAFNMRSEGYSTWSVCVCLSVCLSVCLLVYASS